ncbi:MAG: GGDEF domain-containing protein [Solirubrobacteraceae bacterium]
MAHARDLAGLARDQAAAARDLAMAQWDAAENNGASRVDFGMEILARAAEHRRRAATYRAKAAEHRLLAADDRLAAARDRENAAAERQGALHDREILAAALAAAETDALTGVRTRLAGLADLEREADRCRRTGEPMSVGYVDVVGLKEVNDGLGHAAGDQLLTGIVDVLKTRLRPYDLIVRLGGDEFLCAMSNMTVADAQQRFSAVAAEVCAVPHSSGLRTGFATLAANEAVADLIARADDELTDSRHASD